MTYQTETTTEYPLKPLQVTGVEKLVECASFAIFDSIGLGKSKQVIEAARRLFEARQLDRVLVVCPMSVINTWCDPADGELMKHGSPLQEVQAYGCPWLSWNSTPKYLNPQQPIVKIIRLTWLVINYDKLIGPDHLTAVLNFCRGGRTMLVLDESSYVKNHKAKRSKACHKIRNICQRAVLLNGTPIGNNLMDLFSQFNILNPAFINHMNFWVFRANFAIMGGYKGKQIIGYQNQAELFNMLQPHFLARKREVLEEPTWTRREVELSPDTWKIYKSMRDDMMVELESQDVVVAQQAIVKIIRLSQITSGLLEDRDISSEKIEAFLQWWEEVGFVPVVAWCRFRREIERLAAAVAAETGKQVSIVIGGQSGRDRTQALSTFKSRGGLLVGQQQAGGYGLNLQDNCNLMAYLSNDYNLLTRLQSEGRVHREGQTRPVTYVDFTAVGQKGRKTIDHIVLNALNRKRDLTRWTSGEWLSQLKEVEER